MSDDTTDKIVTESGYYLTVRFTPGVGIVLETEGAKHFHRTILSREGAQRLAEQLDLANLNAWEGTNL